MVARFLYNTVIGTAGLFLRGWARLAGKGSRSKAALFARGQSALLSRIREEMAGRGGKGYMVWFHAASLGEFAVARPLIKRLKEECGCVVVVTFFSPTGYEALRKRPSFIDHVFYLPLDTRGHARAFLDAVRPDKAVFMISEYWCNYLEELRKRHIPTYLVSALIHRRSPFFRWYGGIYRRCLAAYTHIFVLDEESRDNLHGLGYDRVTVCGDPLFDNAALIARTPWSDAVVERFAGEENVFIAGSISDRTDLELVASLANRHRDTRFLFVPHEITPEELARIREALEGGVAFYSDCDARTDFSGVQVLVIDFVGALASLYRYARWAYVGGGFTPLLHSVIEATVYGIPVSFGPEIHRKVTPQQLIGLRIGQVVRSAEELQGWFAALKENRVEWVRVKETAADYVSKNLGATEQIVARIKPD